jgi:hypothetical protein
VDRVSVTEGLLHNPITSINWRRHRSGCPQYRVRWLPHNDFSQGEPMYQVFCGMNTPPTTFEEQERCLASKTQCWRIAEGAKARRQAAGAADIPLDSIKRRKPA